MELWVNKWTCSDIKKQVITSLTKKIVWNSRKKVRTSYYEVCQKSYQKIIDLCVIIMVNFWKLEKLPWNTCLIQSTVAQNTIFFSEWIVSINYLNLSDNLMFCCALHLCAQFIESFIWCVWNPCKSNEPICSHDFNDEYYLCSRLIHSHLYFVVV